GVLAEEIIVALIIEPAYRIGIDINAVPLFAGANIVRRMGIGDAETACHAIGIVGNTRNIRQRLGRTSCCSYGPRVSSKAQRVDEDVIILFRLVMQVVATQAEIERAAEVGDEAKFMAELPRAFFRQI